MAGPGFESPGSPTRQAKSSLTPALLFICFLSLNKLPAQVSGEETEKETVGPGQVAQVKQRVNQKRFPVFVIQF